MQTSFKDKALRWSYISIFIGLILIFASQYFAYKNVQDLSLHNQGVNVTIGILNQTANFGLSTKDAQSNMNEFVITGNEKLLADTYTTKVKLLSMSDTLFNLVKGDKVQTARVRELLDISGKIVLNSQNVINVYRALGNQKAFELIKQGEGIRLNKMLMDKIAAIEQSENSHLNKQRALIQKTQKKTTLFIAGTSIFGFFLTLFAVVSLLWNQKKQRQLEHEITQKEQILAQYIEAIPDGVMVLNTNKDIVLLNQSGREILGLNGKLETLAEQVKKLVLLDPSTYNIRFTSETLPVSRALEGEKSDGNKIDLIKNNALFHLETSVRPVVGLDGEITNAITVFRDITERANYEATLEKARTLAEKSVLVKDIFLSNVSHEIRTPLNAIIGFTNLLEEEVSENRSSDYVSYIKIASRNLLELINDILDFSKIEAGQVILDKTNTSISELVESVSVIIDQRANEKGIHYEKILSPGLPDIIITDKLRITQILLNVCGNSIKFTEKGSVKIQVAPVSPIVDNLQTIRFTITDSGIGIPAEKVDKIFERFVQASESTTRLFGGTGLGLSIVKSLVQILGGTIKVESQFGQGTTFILDFPFEVVTDYTLTDSEDTFSTEPVKIGDIHVLAAEDNLLNQKLLEAIFERLSIDLTIVNNGQEAIEAIEKNSYDLVLMDIQMPIMDGYTAIRKIRSSISQTLPIITMTAHAMVGEKEECLSIGANSYISKPFRENELLHTISSLTGKQNTNFNETNSITHYTEESMNANIVNLPYLNEITGGDPDLQKELISLFENELEIQSVMIHQAEGSGDNEKLRQVVHKFRSSLFSVGLLATADKYKKIEGELKNNIRPVDLKDQLAALQNEAELGLNELKTMEIS
ncbi:PAS domain S-box-containing protein [Dyadobacter koreensis]|uniref:histidine kinase n=1 Tax=Dyadobacter koreensis TaxID=408657 RepID=A0A1H6QNT0_9BACT|nr:ATP-binding protein [Dyadobacter koreensis]SEI42634.1 PAS domain S-box-containing protein [Dyadobacter koreensis]